METTVGTARLPAVLDLPAGPVRGGLVVLHGSHAEQRSYFLYAHLARLLPAAGIAVLRYDRRPRPDGHDVPLADQAEDASAALARAAPARRGGPGGALGFQPGRGGRRR
nr:lysophospholipase [Micromonospora provocatoris]